jgi:hypothetical protein
LNPDLPTRPPPPALYRASFGGGAWQFPEVRGERTAATLVGFVDRETAIKVALRTLPWQRSTVDVRRFHARRGARASTPYLSGIETSMIRNVYQFQSLPSFLHESEEETEMVLDVQGMTPTGTFVDLMEPGVISKFKFDLRFNREFHELFGFDRSDEITPTLLYVIANSDIRGRHPGGYLHLVDGRPSWVVFPSGVGSLHEPQLLDASNSELDYLFLTRLASELKVAGPHPSRQLARQLLSEALTADQYHALAEEVDVEAAGDIDQ